MSIVMAELLKPFIDYAARGGGKYPSAVVVSRKRAMYAFHACILLVSDAGLVTMSVNPYSWQRSAQ